MATPLTLARPIANGQFRLEFADIWRRSKLHDPWRLALSEALSVAHRKSCRRYARMSMAYGSREYVFEFAPETLWLPVQYRLGLYAHEVGHALADKEFGAKHTEDDADDMAAEVLGIEITYSKRWPGKGLQQTTWR
jgi:hypothetical protein